MPALFASSSRPAPHPLAAFAQPSSCSLRALRTAQRRCLLRQRLSALPVFKGSEDRLIDRERGAIQLTLPEGVVLREPLCKRCSWGIGGPARYLACVRDVASLRVLLGWATSSAIPVWVLGRGSNTLFDDRGFDGLVIVNELDFVEELGAGRFRVGSGHPFNRLGLWTASRGWGGLGFAAGIPGTVGGAAFMNAGSNGQDTAEVAVATEVLHADGSLELLDLRKGSDHGSQFGYRTSPFQRLPRTSVIVSVTFQLRPDPLALAKAQEDLARRKATQPLQDRSAGSVFRNPSTGPEQSQQVVAAGKIIEDVGLKGASLGGAEVSPRHANFFVNKAGSTSEDMRLLIRMVKQRVLEETGIHLEEEICVVPYSGEDDIGGLGNGASRGPTDGCCPENN